MCWAGAHHSGLRRRIGIGSSPDVSVVPPPYSRSVYRKQSPLDVVFVPWGTGNIDQHVRIGAAWLREQPGRPAVFVPLKQNYDHNGTLPQVLPHVDVITERAQRGRSWRGGPMLVCWPTEKMLGMLSESLRAQVTAACVLEWGDAKYQRAWLAANNAVDLTTGKRLSGNDVALAPVVLAAMNNLNLMVNHANGLGSSYDKGLAIQTMTALVRHGHRYDVNDVCAWALANGFTASEVETLRDIATKALSGHRFRAVHAPLRDDIVKVWEAEVPGESAAH
jgi:hypothetical protein